MKNIYLIVTVVLFSFIISGCTIPNFPGTDPFNSNTPSGIGVIIQNFEPDFSEVYSGEPVIFSMKVKNTGSVNAESGFAELLGLDQTWESGEGTIETEREELFPNEEECRHTSKKIKLLAEEPDKGISGGEKVCTWTYIAPSVKTGLKVHATPRVRFFYKYSSSTIKTITIVPREELKTLQNQGKGLPSESYSKTRSPIDIGIETSSPVRSYGDSVEFPIIITVKNTGGGTVCKTIENCKKATWGIKPDTDINEGWYVVNLDIIIPPDSTIKNCNEMEKVVLIGTTPQTFSCKMTVNIRPDQIGLIQKKIEVRADYGYFIDKSSSVTVLSSNQP